MKRTKCRVIRRTKKDGSFEYVFQRKHFWFQRWKDLFTVQTMSEVYVYLFKAFSPIIPDLENYKLGTVINYYT